GGGLKHMRGDLLAAFDHQVRRLDDRRAARRDRARAAGAAAYDQLVAVALQEPDFLEWDAELLAQHLGIRRGVALAIIKRAGDDRDIAVRLKANPAHFLVRRRRHFEITADPDAAQ